MRIALRHNRLAQLLALVLLPCRGRVAEKLRHNRLAQFLALGGLIFLVTPRPESSRDIALTGDALSRMEHAEAEKKGHAERAEIDERAIEDELLYREALRVGFDKNDAVVKQRLIQKMLFFAEELKGAVQPPRDGELSAFYGMTRPTWKKASRFHLRQILMKDPASVEALLLPLKEGKQDPERAFRGGQPCPLPREVTASADDLARSLGEGFVRDLSAASERKERFIGPIRSAFGFHLIELIDVVPGGTASFDEVKDRVREVYLTKRREDAVSEYLKQAFARYQVTIDGRRVESISPAHRLAFRSEDSGED